MNTRPRWNRTHPLLAATVVLLCGCADVSMKPYQRPDSPAKTGWAATTAPPTAPAALIQQDWWREFRDPELDGLVARALRDNADLRILAARTKVAGAQIDEARAGALPTLDAGEIGRAHV